LDSISNKELRGWKRRRRQGRGGVREIIEFSSQIIPENLIITKCKGLLSSNSLPNISFPCFDIKMREMSSYSLSHSYFSIFFHLNIA
jgi:hypothetical protein